MEYDMRSGFCGPEENTESVSWTLDESGKLTITGEGPIGVVADLEGWKAFDQEILTVEICDGVTAIGDGAFRRCKELKEVYLPEGLVSIGDESFYYCLKLDKIVLPSTLNHIGQWAFRACRRLLNDVHLPETLTDIANDAFEKAPCSSKFAGLTYVGGHLIAADMSVKDNIDIREGTVVITDGTFNDCPDVTSITIPASVERIGTDALLCGRKLFNLRAATDNERFRSVKGVLFNKDMTALIAYPAAAGADAYCVPDGVETVCEHAFFYAKNLKTICLSEGVKTLGAGAVSNCEKLVELRLPKSLETIEAEAVADCDALETVRYAGSEADWNAVSVAEGNDLLEVIELVCEG